VRVPIRVELRTERGEVVGDLDDPAGGTFDAAGDFDGVLPQVPALPPPPVNETFTLLRYVDPYGNTVFNRGQMDDLLRDIEVATTRQLTPVQRRGLDRLRVMAHRCKDSVHLYVWFIGD
jgi:hypothetical protein